MIRNIPPHIFYPGLVIAILSMSFIANGYLLYSAQSDGGPQIIDDYYDKAVSWEESQKIQKTSDAMQWGVKVVMGEHVDKNRRVHLTIQDQRGTPVEKLQGLVKLHHPAIKALASEAELQEVAPGRYEVLLPINRKGLWDFIVDAKVGEQHLIKKTRLEVLD